MEGLRGLFLAQQGRQEEGEPVVWVHHGFLDAYASVRAEVLRLLEAALAGEHAFVGWVGLWVVCVCVNVCVGQLSVGTGTCMCGHAWGWGGWGRGEEWGGVDGAASGPGLCRLCGSVGGALAQGAKSCKELAGRPRRQAQPTFLL
jgi:hypothetical protein